MATFALWAFAAFGCVCGVFVILDLLLMRHRHKWEFRAYKTITRVEIGDDLRAHEAKGVLLVCGICNKAKIVDRYPLPLPKPLTYDAVDDLRERVEMKRRSSKVDAYLDRLWDEADDRQKNKIGAS